MELVQEKNASSILADLTSRSLASSSFCALPLSKEFASSSPPERKLLFFCIPGCLSPQHQHQATRLAGLLLAGSWSPGSGCGGRAGGRGAGGVSSAQRVKRQGRRGAEGGGGRAPGLRAPRPQPAAGEAPPAPRELSPAAAPSSHSDPLGQEDGDGRRELRARLVPRPGRPGGGHGGGRGNRVPWAPGTGVDAGWGWCPGPRWTLPEGCPVPTLGCPLLPRGPISFSEVFLPRGFPFLLRGTPSLVCLFPWIPLPSPGHPFLSRGVPFGCPFPGVPPRPEAGSSGATPLVPPTPPPARC